MTKALKEYDKRKDELISAAKAEIKSSKNLDTDYLNNFLTQHVVNSGTAAFLNINLDVCQYVAKLQLATAGDISWDHKENSWVFNF